MSVLVGHVVGSFAQTALGIAAVLGAALPVGFRPTADPRDWLALAGLLVLLPFPGSGFVPTDTTPGALRWFAGYQPFTPVIETLRGLVTGAPVGGHLWAKALFNRESTR